MRALMFYKEQKQKKIAKIKSKTYHKIQRKALQRKGLEELKDLDPELAREEAEKLEMLRAQVRSWS
jgi:U3 small nucleolar RNA-associated protein 14